MATHQENLHPLTLKRVAKELSKLAQSPPDGVKLQLNDQDLTDIEASIRGPVGTPYENGVFKVKLVLGPDFPSAPPKGFFLTKIFHPNVAKNGAICVNTLKKDWKSDMGLEHVLVVIKCLLIHPNPASALNEEAGKLLLEDFEDFAKHARMMTEIHAKPSRESCDAGQAGEGAETTDADKPAAAGASSAAVAAKKRAKKQADKKRSGLKRL